MGNIYSDTGTWHNSNSIIKLLRQYRISNAVILSTHWPDGPVAPR